MRFESNVDGGYQTRNTLWNEIERKDWLNEFHLDHGQVMLCPHEIKAGVQNVKGKPGEHGLCLQAILVWRVLSIVRVRSSSCWEADGNASLPGRLWALG